MDWTAIVDIYFGEFGKAKFRNWNNRGKKQRKEMMIQRSPLVPGYSRLVYSSLSLSSSSSTMYHADRMRSDNDEPETEQARLSSAVLL